MRAYVVALTLLLAGCGYHLVGQGDATVIPSYVSSASLSTNAGVKGQALLVELEQLWRQNKKLPPLGKNINAKEHVTLRIEQARQSFVPVAYDASGLAIQYQLRTSAVLNMYQNHGLIWGSGVVTVSADVFGDAASAANNPSVVEAEREKLTEQLNKQWAQDALARLQSGF